MAAYKRYRSEHISLNLEYASVGSWGGKDAIKTNDDIEYAGSDSLLSASDATQFPDLITFPTMAGWVTFIVVELESVNISRFAL